VIEALAPELERAMRELGRQSPPTHYLAYEVYDRATLTLRASEGGFETTDLNRRRTLDVDVRVGTRERDSGTAAPTRTPRPPELLPIEDDPVALRAEAWSTTLSRHREAVSRLARLEGKAKPDAAKDKDDKPLPPAEAEPQAGEPTADPDARNGGLGFTSEKPVTHIEPFLSLDVDRAHWEPRLRAASLRLREAAHVIDSSVALHATSLNRSFVSSEGARVQTGDQWIFVTLFARTLAPDGDVIDVQRQLHARRSARLPDDAALDGLVSEMLAEVEELRRAPAGDTFDGPALLEGRAAGVFMHEVIGHRMEAEKVADDNYGQTFTRKLGQEIMPGFLSVYDDPTVTALGDVDLAGAYRFDDEGVPAQRARLVEAGVLRGFLQGRTPVPGSTRSNGHGRREEGFPIFARQGALITEPSVALSREQLRAELLAEARRQGRPYGIYVAGIHSGVTHTAVTGGQSVTLRPTRLYRVYTDGRPDERIRSVHLIGTPLTLLSQVLAAGDDYAAFNGGCGSGSGMVPLSSISPSLLVRQVELQRVRSARSRPPLVERPTGKAAAGVTATAAPADDASVRQAMETEMKRSMTGLKGPNTEPPRYLSYTVTDAEFAYGAAAFGGVTAADLDRQRNLRIDIRVGDDKGDSGNFFDPDLGPSALGAPRRLSFEDDPLTLRLGLWQATDEAFRRATRLLGRKRAALAAQATASEAQPADWSPAPPRKNTWSAKGANEPLDPVKLAELARALSSELRAFPELHESRVAALHHRVRQRVLTSDGAWKDERRSYLVIQVNAATQAEDGMPLQNTVAFDAAAPSALPSLDKMQQAVRQLGAELTANRTAKIPDAGSAVVMFEGRAAAQLIRQVLSGAFSGTAAAKVGTSASRTPSAAGSDTASFFGDKLGQRIAPGFVNVVDDPAGKDNVRRGLFGSYAADDEAIAPQRVNLVSKGVLTDLLMSRTPGKKRARSNGHGRSVVNGGAVRGGAGVLVVSAGKAALPDAALGARALKEARGAVPVYVVRNLVPGPAPRPLVIERVSPGGKRELVRGLSFTNLGPRTLKDVVAMGRTPYVYNFLGARTPGEGGAPATVVAPTIVVTDVEVRSDGRAHRRPPVYPHPSFGTNVSSR
jgi:predicted Zn-dependent protease